jgi:hypothetical protein
MNKVIKVIIGLLCIPLLALGAKAMFDPTGMIEQLAVDPQGLHGLNTIRGDIGGYMIGVAFMMIAGLWTKNTGFFVATSIMMSTVLVGRFAGLALDGFDTSVVLLIVVELVIIGVMILAHKRLASGTE